MQCASESTVRSPNLIPSILLIRQLRCPVSADLSARSQRQSQSLWVNTGGHNPEHWLSVSGTLPGSTWEALAESWDAFLPRLAEEEKTVCH